MAPDSIVDILNFGFDDTARAHKVLLVNSSGAVIKSTEVEENRSGADASGSDGALGRVLTLQNTSESGNPSAVWVDDQIIGTADYTINHLGGLVKTPI